MCAALYCDPRLASIVKRPRSLGEGSAEEIFEFRDLLRAFLLYFVRDPWLWGRPHEAALVHYAAQRHGSVAARGARAEGGGDAGGRLPPPLHGRPTWQ